MLFVMRRFAANRLSWTSCCFDLRISTSRKKLDEISEVLSLEEGRIDIYRLLVQPGLKRGRSSQLQHSPLFVSSAVGVMWAFGSAVLSSLILLKYLCFIASYAWTREMQS